MENTAEVQVVDIKDLVTVPVSSTEKPEIDKDFEEKWQELVDLAARIIGVPAGLIMRLLEQEIEVFKTSRTDNNPYEQGAREKLGLGLYCETVVGKRQDLLVPNALRDEKWKNNPDVKLNMVSYYGVPIRWPDGEVFGTFCVLDDKENNYTQDQRALIGKFAELVERDLGILQTHRKTADELAYKETRIREMRHRIKNQLNMLISYIDLNRHSGESDTSDTFSHDVQNRIKSLYKLHESLSKPEAVYSIPFPEYLTYIAEEIVTTAPIHIGINIHGTEIYLEEELAVPISMIINELITNSIKYAFIDVPTAHISIDCRDDGGKLTIVYQDNGNGSLSSQNVDKGLGTMIIEGLAAQISAEVTMGFDNGYICTLVIPNPIAARNTGWQ